jgi:hypothetical protein
MAPVALAACGLFVSPHCRSGIGALLVAVPAIFGGLLLSNTVYFFVMRLLWLNHLRDGIEIIPNVNQRFMYTIAISFAGLLVWLAFRSHRSAERGAVHVCRQLGIIAAFLISTLTVILVAMSS